MSLTNVTIDDAGNSTDATIVYSPPLCNGSGWTVKEGQGFGGSYRFCTSANKMVTPSANLTFTGVAVYYMSPYFPGGLMNITIDGAEPQNVNLSMPAGQKSNSSAPAIIWSATNLNNIQHLVELQPSNGSRTLNVDAFIITQVQSNTTGSAAGDVPPISPIPGGFASLGLPVQSEKTTRLSIGLGATFGALSFIIFLFIAIFLGRRQKSWKDQFRWAKELPPLHSEDYADPDVAATRGFTQSKISYQSHKTSRAGDNALAMRPLPSVAHGSFTTNDYEGDFRSELGAKGWASPAHSNTNLISKISSSQGHDDDASLRPAHPQIKVYEPERTDILPSGPLSRTGSTSTHGTTKAPLSRNTTFTSRLEPVRASAASQPSSFNAAFVGGGKDNGALSRTTTYSSPRLEPVRRGTPVSNA